MRGGGKGTTKGEDPLNILSALTPMLTVVEQYVFKMLSFGFETLR